MLIEMLKKHFFNLIHKWYGCIWSNKVAPLKKRPNLYSVDIETDKICQTKKKKDALDSENQKQSLADTFEYRCS